MRGEMNISVLTEESSNSEVKAERLLKTDIPSLPSITVMTDAEDVLTEINAINLKRVTELLK